MKRFFSSLAILFLAATRLLSGDEVREKLMKVSVEVPDLSGKNVQPLNVDKAKGHVLIFTAHDCPVANTYVPVINALFEKEKEDFRFFMVHVDFRLSLDQARKHASAYGLKPSILIDRKHLLVAETGVLRTPEVAVILPGGRMAYRGRIDNLYEALGKKRNVVTRHELRDALKDLRDGRAVRVKRTKAVGCTIPVNDE
ncbi:MAG: redoxin domain-containing protein [Verrucomicrobiota bacterium]